MYSNEDQITLAALDLGTNNCRMLVAKSSGSTFRVVDSFSKITRLGEGLSSSGRLSQDAMDRTINAIGYCARKMKKCGVQLSRNVATEACRRAENYGFFLQRVKSETGTDLEIITAEEEARLALKSCEPLIDSEKKYGIVFDIGGGSSEVIFVSSDNSNTNIIIDFVSLPMGVVTVAEDCGGGDLDKRTFSEVVAKVKNLLRPFDLKNRISNKVEQNQVQMIGVSGTVTTLGGIHLGLEHYDRDVVDGMQLSFSDIALKSKELCKMNLTTRAAEPCIGWHRADLILGGCAILEGICSLWPVGVLRVADRGLREGILMMLIEENQNKSF